MTISSASLMRRRGRPWTQRSLNPVVMNTASRTRWSTKPDQDSTPKVTTAAEAVEQMDSTRGSVEAAEAVDEGAAEAGTENLDLQESSEELKAPDDKEEVVTLSESNEVKDTVEKEAAMAISGDHLEKSPQEVARLVRSLWIRWRTWTHNWTWS